MRFRPALVIPFLALLTAATAACGSDPTGTSAGAAPTTSPTSAQTSSHAHASPRVTTTKTVTVTVTRTTTPHPTPTGTSAASFAPFAGEWVGHTRDVTVSKSGRLEEHVGDGCCDPVIDLVLQLSNPHRSGSNWVATSRVVSAKVHDGWKAYGQPAPKPGDHGTVTIGSDHILVESISSNGFCDPDKTAPGTCGA
jgi:hypothetical protein